MLAMRVALLTDYRGCFWSSMANMSTKTTMNVSAVKNRLEREGLAVRVIAPQDIRIGESWAGEAVALTSAEDTGLAYKSYLEDVILFLEAMGAHTVPAGIVMRAHHNKVLMELLRRRWVPDDPMTEVTHVFGTLEQMEDSIEDIELPAFVKGAAGAGSETVALAHSAADLRRLAARASRTEPRSHQAKLWLKERLRPGFSAPSSHRSKFIVQTQIAGLSGDFKVLKYGTEYFAVRRSNRPGDPRASGGGRLDFQIERYVDPSALLSFAADFADRIPSPFLSMDVALGRDGFFILEYQGLYFGPMTLERSERHWTRRMDGTFEQVHGAVTLEDVYALALAEAVRRGI